MVSGISTAMVSKRVGLILVIVCSVLVTVLSAESSLEVQIEALKAFNNSIADDPFGALADWTDRIHHCNWSGIACDPLSNVISISLVHKQLKGVITRFLGNLSSLQVLDLTSNSFTGHIPAQLGLCSQLSELTLYENSLSGPIPTESNKGNLANLQLLLLHEDNLVGSIHVFIGGYKAKTSPISVQAGETPKAAKEKNKMLQ